MRGVKATEERSDFQKRNYTTDPVTVSVLPGSDQNPGTIVDCAIYLRLYLRALGAIALLPMSLLLLLLFEFHSTKTAFVFVRILLRITANIVV